MQDADGPPYNRYETAVDVDGATEHLEARIDRLEAALEGIEVRLDRLERLMRRGIIVLTVWSMAWMALMVYLTRGGR